jgi:ribosomal protein S17E
MADEGMWLLPLLEELNMTDMRNLGLRLEADDIFNTDSISLKDAVGALDHGSCTAELISPDGLIITNHHCGYSEIQSHSSLAHDYLSEGFWAMNRKEELPNPDKTISFLVSMIDVTPMIEKNVNDRMTEQERSDRITELSEELIDSATRDNHYEGFIYQFYEGNEYYLVLMETFKDIRLVGAPPSSIGKFGDDTDNWVWPRHTGDFCLFRIYTGPDGKPAEYNTDNIPYHPRKYLPVSLKGVKEGDFAMVLGYPGGTYRYLTAAEITEQSSINNKIRIQVGDIALALMKEDMLADDNIRIQYSDKYAAYSNYWKFSKGENKSIDKLGVLQRQVDLEQRFTEWISRDSARMEKYGNVLEQINLSISNRATYAWPIAYIEELFLLYKPIEYIEFATKTFSLYMALEGTVTDTGDNTDILAGLRKETDKYFRDFNPETDKKIATALLEHYADNVDPEYQPGFMNEIKKKWEGNYSAYIDYIFSESIFNDREKFYKFLDKPKSKTLIKDPVFKATIMLIDTYVELDKYYQEYNMDFERNRRLYIAGIMEMMQDRIFYPDANSTLRLSYGTVGDYYPRDAVHYDYFTTLAGVMEKEDPLNPEYRVADKLKELYATCDYGRYGDGNIMTVCFITNNDITGGNSGSPVINSAGALTGVAFDGNWEAMSGNITYEPQLQKCICVDIRYVLFIIDKFANAGHLIKEMQIVE